MLRARASAVRSDSQWISLNRSIPRLIKLSVNFVRRASVDASELAAKEHLDGVAHEMHAYDFLLYAYLQDDVMRRPAGFTNIQRPVLGLPRRYGSLARMVPPNVPPP